MKDAVVRRKPLRQAQPARIVVVGPEQPRSHRADGGLGDDPVTVGEQARQRLEQRSVRPDRARAQQFGAGCRRRLFQVAEEIVAPFEEIGRVPRPGEPACGERLGLRLRALGVRRFAEQPIEQLGQLLRVPDEDFHKALSFVMRQVAMVMDDFAEGAD